MLCNGNDAIHSNIVMVVLQHQCQSLKICCGSNVIIRCGHQEQTVIGQFGHGNAIAASLLALDEAIGTISKAVFILSSSVDNGGVASVELAVVTFALQYHGWLIGQW